jgi:hypothetical protein
MGDVKLLTDSLQKVLRGEKIDEKPLLRLMRRVHGVTANKRKAAAAALLFVSGENEAWSEAACVLNGMLDYEEENGPRAWEVLCPDSHAGIYSLAEVAIVSAPHNKVFDLKRRQLRLVGQRLALYDLIATPDGEVTGLPGVRSNNPKGPVRMAETFEYRELSGKPHRWGRPDPRPLENWNPTSNEQGVYTASAWWWRQLRRSGMLDGFPGEASPPRRLPAGLVTYCWDGGTLAYFERPDDINAFLTRGSAAAKKDADRIEDCCSSVMVTWGEPTEHKVEAVLSWREDPPLKKVPPGARRARIPASTP